MTHSLSPFAGFSIQVDDPAALPMSPDSTPAKVLIPGPRLAVIGRSGPTCKDCRDFQTVVTRDGRVSCSCVSTLAVVA